MTKDGKDDLRYDLRINFKGKKCTWNSFIKTRNPAILLKYKKLSNTIREQTRNLQFPKKKEQNNIAHPKSFGIM